jgi:hypothetical protein
MHLGLVAPKEIQVVRVQGSPEYRLAERRNREIFAFAAARQSGANTGKFRLVTASYP